MLPHSMTVMSAPLLHPDLYSTWLPGVSFSCQLRRHNNFRRLVYLKTIKPPLMTMRDAVIIGYGDIYSASQVIEPKN